MCKDIRAVIFDSDGTLVDSEAPGIEVLYEMAVAAGLTLSRAEAHVCFRGGRMADIVDWIGTRVKDKPEDFEGEFTRRYRATIAQQFRRGLKEIPGAFELLSHLKIPFGVATNGPREKVLLTLEMTGLLPLVGNRIFSAYDKGCFKPSPNLFLDAARGLGHAPEYCAVVEDSIPGLVAGISAGMHVFSLHSRDGLPRKVAESVVFIDSLSHLGRILSRCALRQS